MDKPIYSPSDSGRAAKAGVDTFALNEINRGEFIRRAAGGLVGASALGCLFACAATSDDTSSGDGKNFSGSLTLTTDQKNTLDSAKFLNVDGLIVVLDGATYRAFGRKCPHESGDVQAQSGPKMQCQRHTEQFYTAAGAGNGARTTATLTTYTVTNNAGVLTITG
jgi:nitrite reductase/ring-hydroxylating ferredoxin subunit